MIKEGRRRPDRGPVCGGQSDSLGGGNQEFVFSPIREKWKSMLSQRWVAFSRIDMQSDYVLPVRGIFPGYQSVCAPVRPFLFGVIIIAERSWVLLGWTRWDHGDGSGNQIRIRLWRVGRSD
ncbi:hypothetical protein NPIL_514681 [Nephila pilipes]|uniref:Uncharacterized protein n=1 Tax=Nephila pilipes TaxID=299642 RepID=A0A8X6TDJ1_NEPPI|nr:hypothetical protein NPIL_514681 [Nephila pilipes]